MTEALGIETINTRYMWLDPASGKVDARLRSVRARSAIIVIGTTLDEKIWALAAWAKRSGTQEMVQTFVQMCIKWNQRWLICSTLPTLLISIPLGIDTSGRS